MKQCNNRKFPNGFTLIEILIIIVVVGVLATVTVVLIDPVGQIQKANDSKRKFDLGNIQKTLQAYYEDFGKFPPNPGNPGDCLTDFSQCKLVRLDGITADWGTQFNPYTPVLPKDPNAPTKTYIYYTNGQRYYLYASLDRAGDPQACNLDGSSCDSIAINGIDPNACGGICNYGVSSPNVSP